MNNIDWEDCDEVAKLNEKYSQKLRAIVKKKIEATKNGDEASLEKANKELSKHIRLGELYEKKAEEAGSTWN